MPHFQPFTANNLISLNASHSVHMHPIHGSKQPLQTSCLSVFQSSGLRSSYVLEAYRLSSSLPGMEYLHSVVVLDLKITISAKK